MYLQKDHLENGYNEYLNLNESIGRAGMMDVALLVLDAGESYAFDEADKEIALLLFEGSAELTYDGKSAHIERHSVFDENPTCLLAPARTKISLKADAHTEIYVQKSINPNHFEAKLFMPEDTQTQRAGDGGQLQGCRSTKIGTIFDYDNAPYSTMVLGEVVNFPGKSSSYPPHYHPQPEVYFYRFDKPQGFGAGFANDEIYRTGHNGCLLILNGMHSQTAAPGYAMCYAWGIRHIDGDPWKKTRIDEEIHEWLWADDAKVWEPKD